MLFINLFLIETKTQDKMHPSLMRPFIAARRFTVDYDENGATLTFGHGSDSETASQTVADPANVVLATSSEELYYGCFV